MPIGTYTPPPPGKSITQFFSSIFFFFHFRYILLQISHQKCFFISISIPGRSGVKEILQFHRFVPLSQTHLALYKLSTQVGPPDVVAVTAQAEHDKISEVRIDIEISEQNYVCCLYDNEP